MANKKTAPKPTFFSVLFKKPPQKIHVGYEPEPVTVSRPDIPFRILQSLRQQGIYFVDMESGDYINGLPGNQTSVGLVFEPPDPEEGKKQPAAGFLNLAGQKRTDQDPTTFEVDATIFFEYSGPDFVAGILDPIEGELRFFYFLKVWNDCDVCRWEEILRQVVSDLTITKNGQTICLAKFGISSSFIPNDPTQTCRQKIKVKKTDILDILDEDKSAISHDTLNSEDVYEED